MASILNWRDARRYSPPSDSDETEKNFESSPFLLHTSQARTYSIPTWRLVVPWILSTVAFAFLSLFFYLQSSSPRLRTFETGWRTDFRKYHYIFAYQLLKKNQIQHARLSQLNRSCSRAVRLMIRTSITLYLIPTLLHTSETPLQLLIAHGKI